jgi:hypothetical protein
LQPLALLAQLLTTGDYSSCPVSNR